MKRNSFLRVLFSLTVLFLAFSLSAQKDTITPINTIDVDKHLDQFVAIEGLVVQYTPSIEGSTAYYIIKGEYGRPIKVNTSKRKPVINRKYRVRGIVKADPMTDQPYLVEINKNIIIPIWIYLTVGGILLLILLVALLMVLGGRKKKEPAAPVSKTPPEVKTAAPDHEDDYAYDEGFKTVKIVTKVHDLTLKKIPGQLKILDGEDKGKQFLLQGKVTGYGGAVTIGREDAEGSDKATHIRIMDRTVSRTQAEINFLDRDGRVVLKNLGKVNYSQVNGDEVMEGETREIKFGDKLKFGATNFEYVDE